MNHEDNPSTKTKSRGDPPSSPGERRKRASHACDSCRTKKVKCNEERPCANCIRKNPCPFKRFSYSKGTNNCNADISNKTVVLGLVTSKKPELEKKEDIVARIHEVAKFVPLDRLYLSAQSGFASTHHGISS